MASPAAVLSVLVQARGIEQTNKKLQGIDTSSKKTAKSTESLEKKFSNLDKSVGDFNRTFTASGNVMKLVKFPAMIAGAGMAAQAVGALAAGGVALGSALAPLAGLGAAAAAGYVAMGQAAGVVKLATHGLSDALGGNKKALKALPPAGREIVRTLKALKPQFKDLQQTAQAGLLPGVASALKNATPLFPRLKAVVGDTAKALGDLASRAGRDFSTWGGDITRVGHTNIVVIHNIGMAALALANALRNVVVVGGPLLTWISRMALEGAKWVNVQVEAGRSSGKLAGFLEQTRRVASTLGRILVNLGAALFNIGKAAAPLGRDLLGQFEKLTERFRAWTNSATGKNQIAAYFANARAPLMQIFGLIGDVAGALLRISQGKGATGLVAQLRTLVPVLENVVTSTTAAFGPALIDALGNVLRLFGTMAGSSGPLVQMVRLIGGIAGVLADLFTSNPALNSMAVSFVGLYGTVKALSVVFGPLGAAFALLETALFGEAAAANLAAGATIRQRLALVASTIAMYATTAATVAWTAATVALDAALAVLTSPITLVILGIAALAAGIIYAYKHSETFRNIVNGMWAAIKAVAAWLVTAGVDAFNAVKNAIVFAWNAVKAVTTAVWGGITTYLSHAWKDIHDAAVVAWDAIAGVVSGAWNLAKRVTAAVWAFIHDKVLSPVWAAIKATADVAWAAIRFAILQPARDTRNGLIALWAFIHDKVLTPVWNAIKTAAGVAWAAIRFAVLQPIREARDGLIFVWNFIKDRVLSPVWAAIQTIASRAWEAIKGVILAPIRAVRDTLGGKDGIWQQIKDIAVKAFGSLKTAIKTAADPILDIILAPFKAAAKKVGEFAKVILTVIEKIPGVGNDKIDKAKGSIDNLVKGFAQGGVVQRARGGMVGAMVPGSGSGDKVPLHLGGRLAAMVEPGELVSVANRNATAALMGVNGAVPRFAGGGILNTQEMADLWRSKGGSASLADTMGVIGLVESGGNPRAHNPSGASGLWQILGQLVPGNLFNPGVNALNAIAKYKAQGLHAWDASRSKWGPLLGKKVGPDLNPLKLIGQLPGVGDLPDWLKGTGKYVLDHVGDWIKDNVAKLIPGGGGAGTAVGGNLQLPATFRPTHQTAGLPGYPAIDVFGKPGMGVLSPVTGKVDRWSGRSPSAGAYMGPGGPFGWSMYLSGAGRSYFLTHMASRNVRPGQHVNYGQMIGTIGDYPGNVPDHIHEGVKGLAKGGTLPFVGKFHGGGFADREGYAHVAKGEQIGGPLVNIETVNVGSRTDVNSFAERLAFRVATA